MVEKVGRSDALYALSTQVVKCRECPRLVRWREEVAEVKKVAYRSDTYWGKPVPGFGDESAQLLIVGLAPAAHGANRTGRLFTGDRSGEWLFRALYKSGYANQSTSQTRNDGLTLKGAYITAVCRCAPPQNKPTRDEESRCRPFLEKELALLNDVGVIVALGKIAFDAISDHFSLRPRHKFSHLCEVRIDENRVLLGSYHPSQQNTFTGKLTEEMFDAVFTRACELGKKSC